MRCAGNEHATAEPLVGARGRAEIGWGITIALGPFELRRSAGRERCRRALENAYAGERLLEESSLGEDAATVLCETVGTLTAAQGRREGSCASPSGSRATGKRRRARRRALGGPGGPHAQRRAGGQTARTRWRRRSGVHHRADARGAAWRRSLGRKGTTLRQAGQGQRGRARGAGARLGRTGWRRWACRRAGPQSASGACSTGSGDGVRRQHDAAAGEARH